jgi:hypothetical protein
MQDLKQNILERGAKLFSEPAILAMLDEQTRKDIAEGKKEFALADYYIRKKIAGFGGVVDLMKDKEVTAVGVTNFNLGKLPVGTYIAVCAVGLGYGYEGAATNKPSEQRYSSAEYLNTIPTKILNSEFALKNGDRTLLRARTKKFFANAYAEFGGEANDENAVLLPTPKLMQHDKLVAANFEFANDGLAAPINAHYIEMRISGVMIVDRA